MPEELTPDSLTVYNNIVNGQHDFLNNPFGKPSSINKILKPNDFCVATIGVLIPKPSNCAAVPRAVFSFDEKEIYRACDNQTNELISTDSNLSIGLKLEYYNQRKFIAQADACAIIPFG